jgi:hypothetical protein
MYDFRLPPVQAVVEALAMAAASEALPGPYREPNRALVVMYLECDQNHWTRI